MVDYYNFFFSYARANFENAQRRRSETAVNYLQEFFDEIYKNISDMIPKPHEELGYMDKKRLSVADFWSKQLVESLQKSRVLLAIISPHYLQSKNCGREFDFFIKRLEQHESETRQQQPTHRIIPVFWVDMQTCFQQIHSDVVDLIKGLQLKQEGMPEGYPEVIGASQLLKLKRDDTTKFCEHIARRIYELSEAMEELPKLSDQRKFEDLSSTFHSDKQEVNASSVADGLTNSNVIYVVGTRQEMAEVGHKSLDIYADSREFWRPFTDAPGATVEMATQEGLNLAGQNEYRNLGLPEDLPGTIDKIEEQNSLGLVVLDRNALEIPRIKEDMHQYDRRNSNHIALITAGGTKVNDQEVAEVFEHKFGSHSAASHSWTVPSSRAGYVESIAKKISALKQRLKRRIMSTGKPTYNLRTSNKPTLNNDPEGG